MSELINPVYHFKTLRDLTRFIFRPELSPIKKQSSFKNAIDLVIILAIILLCSLTSNYLVWYFFNPELSAELIRLQLTTDPVHYFVMLVFIAPMLEESCYRLVLRFNPLFLSIAFGIFCHRLISNVFFEVSVYDIENYPLSRIAWAAVFSVCFYVILSNEKISSGLKVFWGKKFKWICWLSCLVFAFVHVTNFNITPVNILLMPLLTLPQLFLGVGAAYMRIKCGFMYAMLLHALYNSSHYLAILF
jgi:hypothetical protein